MTFRSKLYINSQYIYCGNIWQKSIHPSPLKRRESNRIKVFFYFHTSHVGLQNDINSLTISNISNMKAWPKSPISARNDPTTPTTKFIAQYIGHGLIRFHTIRLLSYYIYCTILVTTMICVQPASRGLALQVEYVITSLKTASVFSYNSDVLSATPVLFFSLSKWKVIRIICINRLWLQPAKSIIEDIDVLLLISDAIVQQRAQQFNL